VKKPRSAEDARTPAFSAQHALLVSSNGGHLTQMLALRPWWVSRQRTWITFATPDAQSRLVGEHVIHAYHPTTRNLANLMRNSVLAARTLLRVQPDLIVSTGAGVAIPFFVAARILGVPAIYIEVIDRIDTATLTGRICYPLCEVFMVQWPQQLRLYPRAQVIGTLL
jgi:UDP-N-acetylglucosamine:LPS N-acetylglucosamine transferase